MAEAARQKPRMDTNGQEIRGSRSPVTVSFQANHLIFIRISSCPWLMSLRSVTWFN